MTKRTIYELTRELQTLYSLEESKARELGNQLEALGKAYLRLRELIGPDAFDTPHAPSPEQVWKVTEDALIKRLGQT